MHPAIQNFESSREDPVNASVAILVSKRLPDCVLSVIRLQEVLQWKICSPGIQIPQEDGWQVPLKGFQDVFELVQPKLTPIQMRDQYRYPLRVHSHIHNRQVAMRTA